MRNFSRNRRERNTEEYPDSPKRFRDNPSRFTPQSSGKFERRDSPRLFERRMHLVTCAKCHERCQVPFRPTEGKPVYCSECFKNNDRDTKDDNYQPKYQAPSRNEFEQIHEKLDRILFLLQKRH